MKSFRVIGVAVTALILTVAAFSQTGTSAIRGTVTDPQGRVVPGASVTLTNLATSATRSTQSTDTGAYSFDFILPGNYRLEVTASGFKVKKVENVHALIGKSSELNVQLEIGTKQEVVDVTATGQEALVNTQDASLGNVFVTQQIAQLPLEARSVVDLLSLQPGATREGYVTGARADQSNVTLDGVDINNAQTSNVSVPESTNTLVIGGLGTDRGNITSGPVLRLNSLAIQEFRVTTANGNANQGRSSGSQINLVTKSGTNKWHGAAFEYYRSRGFTANDWFNNHATDVNGNSAPIARPPLVRNTFSGAIGGPIVKDRAFFFYSYEGRRDASAQAETRVVPLANLGQGTVNYLYCTDASCSNVARASLNITPGSPGPYAASGINGTALAALAAAAAKYPANDTSQGDGLNTGGFRFNAPTPVKLNSHVARFDVNINSHQTAFARLNVLYDHQTLPQWLPDTPAPLVWNHPWGLALGHTWTIGNNWVNNFRYGYTRQAFSQLGDSSGNDISFRFVFQPNGQQHTLTRVTPVHNFTDDVSYVRGNHTLQFGVNIRKIDNNRVSYANAFDNAITNPSFYLGAGEGVSDQFQAYLDANNLPGSQNNGQALSSVSEVQNAGTAIIGRFSQYTANFTFAKDGTLLSTGSPADRNFATQAYDTYLQDTWKVRPSLTLTLGLRYSLERPVYETHGFEVQPTVPLSTFFQERLTSARNGVNFVQPIVINRSGPANGGKPMYNWDKNNFQPRIAFAWSLDSQAKSVLRGGFSMTNDYYGEALAVDWDLNNTLGFTSNYTTPANTFDTTPTGTPNGLAPLFTGFNQSVQTLPLVVVPADLKFPLQQPIDYGERIESSVDSALHAPTEYVWNLTFERQLPKDSVFSLSYIGRAARGLLAHRDVAAFNNLRDPKSGMDWYTAGTMLEKMRAQGVDTSQVAPIPFFEDMLPKNFVNIVNNDPFIQAGMPSNWTNTQAFYAFNSRTPSNPYAFFGGNDWTDTQALADIALFDAGLPTLFMQPQYGALSAWSTVGNSNYNALAASLRTRIHTLTLDFNYTWSHSLDDASGLQTEAGYGNNNGNGSFIVNPIRQGDNYAGSDFDIRHNINIDAVWQMPFGKGRALMNNAPPVLEAILGGWQIAGIYRWNTGLPTTSPYDDARWATNWNVQANVTPTQPLQSCFSKGVSGQPKLFGGCDITKIYQSFRNAYPGETGPRNYLRYPGYVDLDLGLSKTWNMPWKEGHQLQLRWDVFNVTNTQRFGLVDISRTGMGVGRDPGRQLLNPPDNWSNFTQIQGQPRVMQIGAEYTF